MTATTTKQRLSLREDVTLQPAGQPLQVDREHSVVRDVKVLGLESRNGRRYLREALAAALHLYQAAKCNLDHPESETASRKVLDRFGRFGNVRLAEDGYRGDFSYNPAHPFAATFLWWCENDPGAIGFSHNATGEGEPDEHGTLIVSAILEVHSIDLVADPATTNGLRESIAMDPTLEAPLETPAAAPDAGEGDWKAKLADAMKSLCMDDSKTPDEKWQSLEQIFQAMHPPEEETDEEEEEPVTPEPDDKKKMEAVQKLAATSPSVRWLLGKLDGYQVKEAIEKKKLAARLLCKAAGLPKAAVSDVFVASLVECRDPKATQRLIEDRRQLLAGLPAGKKPTSAGKGGGEVNFDQFLAALRDQV